MTQGHVGRTITLRYTGTLDDGTVFDASTEDEPLTFTIGEGEVFPELEQAVVGMQPGETKTITIPVERAYGPREEDQILEVDLSEFVGADIPQVGDQVLIDVDGDDDSINDDEDDNDMVATVIAVSESRVTLDTNHPLAGEDLTFTIELLDVQ